MFNITQAASEYIKQRINKEQGIGFRLSIKKTGCSGYSYQPTIVKSVIETDNQFKFDDLTVYVDSLWLHLFNGLSIDYVEEIKAGLKQKRLVFINPNETNRCGCGESFHV